MKFGEFCEVQPKVDLKKGAYYAFLPMEDVNPLHSIVSPTVSKIFSGGGAKFSSGDTVFARITPCLENGKIAYVNDAMVSDGFGSTEFLVFRAKPEVSDPIFLFYLCKSSIVRGPAIKSMVGSSGRQRARREVIEQIDLPDWPLSVQVKIGRILRAYDDLIENNRRRIALLEESARLLYREWYVHLRFPGHEHYKTVDGVPEGWESFAASKAISINPKTDWDREKEIRMVPMAALSERGLSIDPTSFETREKPAGVRFQNGDTLLARITPCLENGKTGFVNCLDVGEVACGSTEFIVLREHKISRYFVYLLAREESFRNNAIKSMVGSSGRQRVQPSCFDKYRVAVPPAPIAMDFDDQVRPIFEQIAKLQLQAQQATNARDLLLPRLMDGRIEV